MDPKVTVGCAIETDTGAEAGLTCQICKKVFDRQSRLESHMRSHTGEKPFACSFLGCGKLFGRKDHVTKHEMIHTGTRNYKCTVVECSKHFTTSSQLKRHQKTHENPNPYICSECSIGFPKKSILREHNLQLHSVAEFACKHDNCGKIFISQSKLDRHVFTHEKHYVCNMPECHVVLPNYLLYRKHNALHNRENFGRKRKRSNDDCSLTVESVASYDSSEGDSDCWPIDEEFRIFDGLFEEDYCKPCLPAPTANVSQANGPSQNPIGSVNNLKFPCLFLDCGRSFTMSKNLKAHIKAVHTEHDRFVCSVAGCNQRFGWKSVLDRHILKVHVQDKDVLYSNVNEDPSTTSRACVASEPFIENFIFGEDVDFVSVDKNMSWDILGHS